ncbi:MAG: hypothetical protein DI570_19450 [Phenylobacterium zucineum]|nr:MAG: hypothetical protein DI570_19450 [Phenylobacterium zucineum]
MKPLYLVAASALALTAAACGPKVPAARAALECPAKEGDLTRTSAAGDGKTCTYVTGDGAEVTLQLVSVQGNVDATLAGVEKTLLVARAPMAPGAARAEASAADATSKAAEKANREARDDTKAAGVTLSADENGLDVKTENGEVTRVELPGVHIVANDAEDTAKVQIGPLSIDAGNEGAKVRIRRDVRLRGEAFSREKRGVRATFIYTGDELPDGYRFVGYEAAGPKRGPITIAVVKAKLEGESGDEIYPDVKKLVRKNGGV